MRIRRKRTKGYDMQAESLALNGLPAVYVGRPSKWQNLFRVGEDGSAKVCVKKYRQMLEYHYPIKRQMIEELRGKNLACWCPLDQPCHADVLLELANGGTD